MIKDKKRFIRIKEDGMIRREGWKRVKMTEALDAYGICVYETDPKTHFHMSVEWRWEKEGYVPPISPDTMRRHGLPGGFGHYMVGSGGDGKPFSAYSVNKDLLTEDWFERWRNSGEGAVLGRAMRFATIDSVECLESYSILCPPIAEQKRICLNMERAEYEAKVPRGPWWVEGLTDRPKTEQEEEQEAFFRELGIEE